MKTLRYLLIAMVIGLASASMQAQVKQSKQSEKVEYQFHSTSSQVNNTSSSVMGKTTSTLMGDGQISSLMTSGSRLPIAARNGVIVGSTSPDDNTSNGGAGRPGLRRGKKDDNPFGDDNVGGTDDPQEPGTPIGDGMWVLMVLATVFCGVIYLRRKRAINVKELKS